MEFRHIDFDHPTPETADNIRGLGVRRTHENHTGQTEDVRTQRLGTGNIHQSEPRERADLDPSPVDQNRLLVHRASRALQVQASGHPDRGEAWNMSWEFVIPREVSMDTWYTVPHVGTMRGFPSYDFETDFVEKGADLPKMNRRTQQLPFGELKARGEYIIWFSFKDDKPVDTHVRISLTPFGE
jgi:hypothetical protein